MKNLKLLTRKRLRLLALLLCLTASIPHLWADNTYVVAGEPAAVFGTTWNTTLSSNQMTNYATNSYMLIKPNCSLTGANIYYKVVGNGSNWYGNSSGQDFQISTGSGTYDVIFGFYSDNTTYQVYQILQRVNIAGCTELMGVYWDTSQNRMTAGTTSYTLTLTDVSLSTGTTYTYKAVVDGNTWYGQGGTTSGGNYELTVTETGVYDVTFEYNPITHKTTTRTTLKSTPADTYVVAGPAAMFGDNWNGTSTANTMTEGNDGKYRLTLYNLTLTASTSYEYKVVKNGTEWIPNTVDNASFSVALNGAYDVTFIYDPSTGVYNVECTLQTATGGETYTVAGSNTVILGSSWDPTDSNNDMSLVSGVYQLTFNDVVLSDNNPSCEFRIAVNQSWVTAYPSGNANVSGFDGSGTYDIVFTYNPTTHDVTGVATKHAVIVNYYVLGDEALGLSWTPTPTTTMTYDDNTGLYTYTYYVNNSGTHRFIFANGQATGYSSEQIQEAWDYFNSHYRIGPINGDQSVALNASMTQTQMANDNHSAYQVTLGVGTYTIYYDPNNMTFRVEGAEPIYITGDLGLGLGWNYAPTTAMAYDDNTGLYSYTYKVPKQGTYNFVFANGQATGYSSEQEAQAWDYFNSNYRIGPNVAAEEYVVGTDNWKSTQMAGADKGAYSVKLAAGNVSIYFDKAQMQFKIESNGELGDDLYMVGGLTVDDSIHYYAPNDGVLMKYDNTKKLYYLNHVTPMPTPTRLTLSPKKATLQPTSR